MWDVNRMDERALGELQVAVTTRIALNEAAPVNRYGLLRSYVTVDPTLCDCLLEKSEYQEVASLKWDDLFSR